MGSRKQTYTMKLAIFALFAAGALAQKAKVPLNQKQLNAAQNQAVNQANIAQKKAISKLQAQAKKAGINVNVQKTVNSIKAQNEAKVAALAEKYTSLAQKKQGELEQQYKKEINQAKDASFKSVQASLNQLANQHIGKVPNNEAQKFLQELQKFANNQINAATKKQVSRP